MNEPLQLGYYAPRPTYFITLRGTLLVADDPFTIENFHQRENDPKANPLVKVIIQNRSTTTSVVLAILDETKTECLRLSTFNSGSQSIQEIVCDSPLKLSAVFGFGTVEYQVMAFYAKPS